MASTREQIDKAVDWRKANRPKDESDISIAITPKELHRALGLPRPIADAKYPDSVLYRGLRVKARAG